MTTTTVQYKRLVESMPTVPWKIDWHSKEYAYIAPQIENILGWRRESWVSMDVWIKRIHPLDRERILSLQSMNVASGSDFEAEYSVLTIAGEFDLVQDIVHVARNPEGEVEALMGFLRRVHSR